MSNQATPSTPGDDGAAAEAIVDIIRNLLEDFEDTEAKWAGRILEELREQGWRSPHDPVTDAMVQAAWDTCTRRDEMFGTISIEFWHQDELRSAIQAALAAKGTTT